ncbi:MAG: HAD family phosphatase [Haloarculaceae archaeon]
MTLVAFDFHETLSVTDLSVALGRAYDQENEILGLADQSRRGQVDFGDSIRQRVSLLEGMPVDRVDRAFEGVTLRSNAADLLAALRRSDVEVAILTGGFERGVRAALDRAGVAVDHLVANRLVVANEALTGDVEGPLVDGEKDQALEEIVVATGVDLDQAIAVGDDARDVPMLRLAGTAIGYEPDDAAERVSDTVITSLRELRLYFDQHGVIEADAG